MTYHASIDVEQLIRERMATGRYASEDELLREALRTLAEQEEDLEAVQQAIAELEAGDEGLPLDEAAFGVRSGGF